MVDTLLLKTNSTCNYRRGSRRQYSRTLIHTPYRFLRLCVDTCTQYNGVQYIICIDILIDGHKQPVHLYNHLVKHFYSMSLFNTVLFYAFSDYLL